MKNNIYKKEYIITKAEYDKLTEAYNKCQEDIVNRKYTEEDMLKAFEKGALYGSTKNGNTHYFDEVISSLNKKD